MAALPNATMYSLHMCTDPFSYNKNSMNSSSEKTCRKHSGKASKCEEKPEEAKDMLDWLLQAGLGPVVTEILLLLDPPSLHAAKQVTKKNTIWQRKAPRFVSSGALISRMRFGVGQGSG